MRSERLFRISRWTVTIAFIVFFVVTTLQIPIQVPLLVGLLALLIASFAYMVFFKCSGCGCSFSTGRGFISITWPYTEKCRKCGHPLGGGRGESA